MAEQTRPRLPQGFAAEVAAALARLEEGQKATNEHLRILNGRTAKSEDRLALLEKALATADGEKNQNKKWIAFIKPIVLMVGTAVGTLLLTNGPRILEGMKGMVK